MPRREVLVSAASLAAAGCMRAPRFSGLVVGSSATGVPFSFIDPKTNALTGALVDIMSAVSKAAAVPVRMEALPFSALIPALTARKIDVIAAAMFKTPARERIVAFTDPVYAYSGGVVLPAQSTQRVGALSDLRGRRVGAQVGSVFVGQLKDAGVRDVVTYDNLSDILRDLGHGRIDAAYGDAPILAYQLRVYPRPNLRLDSAFHAAKAQDVCFVMRKNDPMIGRFNQAIAKVRAGPLDAVLSKWTLDQTVRT
jgi:polar amino acid transport system substrate-binding protein